MSKTPVQLKQLTQLPARNFIINGNFDFWQRGTSVSASGNGTYLADRFQLAKNFGNAPTLSRSTDVPTFAQSGTNSLYSLLVTNNAVGTSPTGTNNMFVQQVLEGYDYQAVHGKKMRLQFWVKSSIAGNYAIGLASGVTNRSYVAAYTITSPNTWEKKTVDVTLDTVGANWAFDNSAGLSINWSLGIGATRQTSSPNTWSDSFFAGLTTDTNTWSATGNATFQLAQVAFYTGEFSGNSLDLPFRRAGDTIQSELAMCQRYYEKSYDVNTVPGTVTNNGAILNYTSITTTRIGGSFAVRKRTTPTMVFYSGATGTSGNTRDDTASVDRAASANSLVGENAWGASVTGSGSGASYFTHFTAAAEL